MSDNKISLIQVLILLTTLSTALMQALTGSSMIAGTMLILGIALMINLPQYLKESEAGTLSKAYYGVKLAGLLGSAPVASFGLALLFQGRIFLGFSAIIVAWAVYACIVIYLGIKKGMLYEKDNPNGV